MDKEPALLEPPETSAEFIAKPSEGMLSTPESILAEAKHMGAQSCFDRAEVLWNGTSGFPVDRGEAALWYEKAAQKGLPQAMFAFAECLRWGDGILRNPTRAEILYRMAAEAGEPRAIQWLAHAYAVGDGVRRDAGESSRWQKKTRAISLPPLAWALLWLSVGVGLALAAWRWFAR